MIDQPFKQSCSFTKNDSGNGSAHKIIRILVADDHAVVRSGLSAFLQVFSDLEMIGEARNGQQAVEQVAALRPDIVLMDLRMPVKDGIQATREIRQRFPRTQVIALTSFNDDQSVKNALEAGANGYLLKTVSVDDLAQAIRTVARGKPVLSPEATQALIRVANQPRTPGTDLTDREHEVLDCLVRGLTNPEIACKLCLSRGTVKFHVSNILTKMGASCRTEAVAMALQYHLV